MKTTERAGAPALGNAVGYFVALWLISEVQWLQPEHSEIAVAMMGTIFIHVFFEIRQVGRFIADKFKQAPEGD